MGRCPVPSIAFVQVGGDVDLQRFVSEALRCHGHQVHGLMVEHLELPAEALVAAAESDGFAADHVDELGGFDIDDLDCLGWAGHGAIHGLAVAGSRSIRRGARQGRRQCEAENEGGFGQAMIHDQLQLVPGQPAHRLMGLSGMSWR